MQANLLITRETVTSERPDQIPAPSMSTQSWECRTLINLHLTRYDCRSGNFLPAVSSDVPPVIIASMTPIIVATNAITTTAAANTSTVAATSPDDGSIA